MTAQPPIPCTAEDVCGIRDWNIHFADEDAPTLRGVGTDVFEDETDTLQRVLMQSSWTTVMGRCKRKELSVMEAYKPSSSELLKSISMVRATETTWLSNSIHNWHMAIKRQGKTSILNEENHSEITADDRFIERCSTLMGVMLEL